MEKQLPKMRALEISAEAGLQLDEMQLTLRRKGQSLRETSLKAIASDAVAEKHARVCGKSKAK